ncbi:CHAP domain-containing protein [Cryptosporangium sp. NPDC051539]|uniref:CHAP domain-containing protein n=1 Tax=Cryptosporangium sp. NPDC051539 TaxID=3363962 RepID=UPI00378EDB76
MSGTAQDLLTVARAEIGVREVGGGSQGNRQKYSAPLGFPVTEWCAIFVSWCLHQAKVPKAYASTRVTLFARHYAAEGRFVKTPRPGDLACFDWERDGAYNHIGIVEKVLPDGRIQTIEGNTNPGNGQDGVYRMVRSPKFVKGYCRPGYAAAGPAVREYVVRSGDTLSGIARRFATTTQALLRLNPAIADPDLIHVGQHVRLR